MLFNFVNLYILKDKKIIKTSIQEVANEEKAERGDKIAAIILIVILFSMFFAPNLETMLFFLFSGLVIGLMHLRRRER
jgi:hypothetical protein